jgi:hypothetical protein
LLGVYTGLDDEENMTKKKNKDKKREKGKGKNKYAEYSKAKER